ALTRQDYTYAIRRFAQWLWQTGVTPAHQLADLPIPARPCRDDEPRVFSHAEFRQLADYLNSEDAGGSRDWSPCVRKLVYWSAIGTATRISELRHLRQSDVSLGADIPSITVRRTDKRAFPAISIPIPSELALALRHHL